MNPVELWQRWLASLPPEVGDELSRHIASMLPGLAIESGDDPSAKLARTILDDARSDRRTMGLALCLAALTDAVTRAQASDKTWAEAKEMLDVLDHASEEVLGEDVGEYVTRARLRAPLLARQWRAAAASWETLRAKELSEEEIVGWLRRRRLEALKPLV